MTEMEDQDTETGYISDSSLNSRQGTQKIEKMEERINIKRKTKSERDKRSSRVSIIEDSETEDNLKTREAQNRYRKRAGSKRPEVDLKRDDCHRRSITSKITAPFKKIQGKDGYNVERQSKVFENELLAKMDNKDIYFGTWNNKEREILDQILNNFDLKLDKKSAKKLKEKDKANKKNKAIKSSKNDEIIISGSSYPMDCYTKDHEKNKNKSGILSGLKKRFGRHESNTPENSFTNFDSDVLNRYMMPQKKKKGLFHRLKSNSKKKAEEPPRRRAYSTNDSQNVIKVNESSNFKNPTQPKRSVSTASLKGLLARTKSADDLEGAFDYYANKNQVFQRTPSLTKLNRKSKAMSIEKLNADKRSDSQKSLHGFEPVQPSAKEICYDNSMIFAQAKMNSTKTASHRSISLSSQSSMQRHPSGDDSSNYDDDPFHMNGYQSDQQHAKTSLISNYPKNMQGDEIKQSNPGVLSCPLTRKKYYPMSYKQLHFQQSSNSSNKYKNLVNSMSVNSSISTLSHDQSANTTYCFESDICSDIDSPKKIPFPSPYVNHVSKRPFIRSFSKNSSASTYSSNYGYLSESSNFEEEDLENVFPFEPKSLQNYSGNDYFEQGFSRSSVKSNFCGVAASLV